MADLGMRVEREALGRHLEWCELRLQDLQRLDVEQVLRVARDQPRFQPAGGVEQEVRAGQERRQHRVEALEHRLRIGPLAGRERAAARPPRQAEAPRQLARGQQADGRLRPAEAGRARLHVGVREERAEQHRRARPHELHVGDARQLLGRLLHQRRRDRHRRHRAHQQERRHDGTWPALGQRLHHLEHRHVVPQRRVDVGDAVHGRRPSQLLVAAVDDRRHRERVARLVAGEQRRHAHLVGQRQLRVRHVEVPRVVRQVGRLARDQPGRVDLVERVPELHEPLQVGDRAVAPLGAVQHERRARRRRRTPCGRRRRRCRGPGCGRAPRTRQAPSRPARAGSRGRTARRRRPTRPGPPRGTAAAPAAGRTGSRSPTPAGASRPRAWPSPRRTGRRSGACGSRTPLHYANERRTMST